jgi:hypothetical protein
VSHFDLKATFPLVREISPEGQPQVVEYTVKALMSGIQKALNTATGHPPADE